MNLTQKIAIQVLALGIAIGGTYYLTNNVKHKDILKEEYGIECKMEVKEIHCRNKSLDKCNAEECLERCRDTHDSKYALLGGVPRDERYCWCVSGIK